MSKKSIVAISDSHGMFNTFLALLDRARTEWGEFDLYFEGDLIDRGPRSKEMVEYAMTNKIPTTLANHEDLCLAYSAHYKMGYRAKCSRYYDQDIWLMNGGIQTLESWGVNWGDGEGLPRNVLDWMSSLPPYIIPDVEPDENGRLPFLSHTGYGLSADRGDWFTALWGRHGHDRGNFPTDNFYRIFGHTQKSEPKITETFAMIDSGAAYKNSGLGNMTAFHWPSKRVIMQRAID